MAYKASPYCAVHLTLSDLLGQAKDALSTVTCISHLWKQRLRTARGFSQARIQVSKFGSIHCEIADLCHESRKSTTKEKAAWTRAGDAKIFKDILWLFPHDWKWREGCWKQPLQRAMLGGIPSLIREVGEGLSPEGCRPMVTQATQPLLNKITLERRPHMLASSMDPMR